jgi:hypothetical protein
MLDTFKQLHVAKAVLTCEDIDYQTSWLEKPA